MSLIRWSNFDDPFAMAEAVLGGALGQRGAESNVWAPRVDVQETPEAVHIEADLPGVDPKGVEIDVKDDVLTLKGERKDERKVEKNGYRRNERVYGKFERRFNLPPTVDQGRIQAKYVNGVLVLTIPKREETKPRRIEVAVS